MPGPAASRPRLPRGADRRTAASRRMAAIMAALCPDAAALDERRAISLRLYAGLVLQAERMQTRIARGEDVDPTVHARLAGRIMRLAAQLRSEVAT